MANTIDTMQLEERRYPPDSDFASAANAHSDIYERDFDEFWDTEARERVSWFQEFSKLYEWQPPYAKWYLGGQLNACFNCVDRHVEGGLGNRVAFHWEGEPTDDRRTITYSDLQREVVRWANALKELGVTKGTPVGIYMGMVPELPAAMLACARLGAPHTVVFGGFSAESLSARMNDMKCTVLVTQDEAWRRGKPVPLKPIADAAMADAPGVKHCLVLRRTGNDVPMTEGRDVWFNDLELSDDPASCPCEPMESEDLLFLMYTSGTTAKPKGIVHTTGGYLVGVSTTHRYIFDLRPEQDVYWCAADVGWITGHSYIVYGPLCNAATSVMYEGTPDFPDKDRWWEIVERYGVTILYTAPTAIRAYMKWGPEYAESHDLSSLRLLGSVGEPINPEAWVWYREHIGVGSHTGCRHLVADRDGHDHDHAAAGHHHAQTGVGDHSRFPESTPTSTTRTGTRSAPAGVATSCSESRGRRCCAASSATTSGSARRTGRSTRPSTSRVTARGRRGRRLLAARPRRRRDERVGPPHLDDRGRDRRWSTTTRRRGRGVRPHRPAHRRGDRRLRDPEGRRRGLGRDARGVAQARR